MELFLAKCTKSPLYSERKIGQALRNASFQPSGGRNSPNRGSSAAEVRSRDRAIHEFSMIASMRATVCNSTRDGGLRPPDTVRSTPVKVLAQHLKVVDLGEIAVDFGPAPLASA